MDLTIDQPSLGRALRLVNRIVPARPTQPVLGSVLLDAEPGRLSLTATDGDLCLVASYAAEVAAAGSAALPARLLGEYVAQLPAEPVRLRLNAASRRLSVLGGRSTADLATVDPAGLSIPPVAEGGDRLDLDPGGLLRVVERVGFAAARDHSRPVLASVLFDVGTAGLTLAATDGFRLARALLPGVVGRNQQMLVPARAVTEFGRLLAEARSACLVFTPDSRGVHLVADRTRLFTPLMDGRFPDLEGVIPTLWHTRVRVTTTNLRQALRLISPFGASSDARPVVLEAANGRLSLQARGDESGEAASEVHASVEGACQSVGLNARLITELLDATHDTEMELTWTSPEAPVVFRETAQPASDLWLVMPLYDAALTRKPAAA